MGNKVNRQTIGRTITLTFCIGFNVIERQVEDYSAILVGDFSPERATAKLRKMNGDPTITIKDVQHETGYYSMDTLEFCKLAKFKQKEGN